MAVFFFLAPVDHHCSKAIAIKLYMLTVPNRAWYGMEDDFSTLHTGNFLPFHFQSTLKIFHSILKVSSIFHSILPYQGKFRPKATLNLYCTFATLSLILQVVVCKGKQQSTIHLIPYLKHYRDELP